MPAWRPKQYPWYAELAAGTGKTAYALALSDWYDPPVIHEVTRSPNRIRVFATDNVQVKKVLVTITNDQGQSLEQGEAGPTDYAWWEYATTASTGTKVLVEVFDLAGNVTRYED